MKHLIVYFDGTCRPNPGKAACAYVIVDETSHVIEKAGHHIGEGTNNIAEYIGLILGLTAAIRHRAEKITVYADSNLVIQQLKGNYRVRDINLQKLHIIATEMLKLFDKTEILYVPHERNQAHSIAQSYLEDGLF
ncbi:MAG TPA: ribonuclease HI family protein [bacterium]|nr:ribonuclease HI family protein [bacterium]HOL36145.1 ribonuclease HI family protein [bacterium]HPP08054.1 ribonuclease HI family protein [bacterium]